MKRYIQKLKTEISWSSFNKTHLWYTVALFLDNFGYGFAVTIFGACLTDVQLIYKVEQRTMSLILIVQSMGYVTGTLVGFLYRWLNRQLMIIIFSLILALTTALTPLYSPLWVAYVCVVFQGLGMGVFGSSYQIWFLEMWPRRINTVLLLNQFLFGLGTVVAPAISSQFVIGNNPLPSNLPENYRLKRILVPYAIAGAFQAISPLILLVLYFTNRYKTEKPDKEPILQNQNSQSENESSGTYRIVMLSLGCIFFSIYFSAENGYLPYCTTMWQNLPINLTSSEANKVMSALSSFYTAGSLVTALVSIKLSPDSILSYHYVIIVIGFSVVFLGQRNIWTIFTGSSILGFGFSCMQGTIFSLVNCHFQLTDFVTSIYLFVSGCTTITVSVILFFFPLAKHPNTLFQIISGCICSSLVCFVTIKLIIMFRTKKMFDN